MGKKSETSNLNKKGKETLTAGRIIKLRLPAETDKPNPFLMDISRPDRQELVTPSGNPQGDNTPLPTSP